MRPSVRWGTGNKPARWRQKMAEQAALIYNYVTTYTGAKGSSFEEEYIWPQPGSA